MHSWALVEDGLVCSKCGQYVIDSELPFLGSIYDKMPCPEFLKEEEVVLEEGSIIYGRECWFPIYHAFNVRQLIAMAKNLESEHLRLVFKETGEEKII